MKSFFLLMIFFTCRPPRGAAQSEAVFKSEVALRVGNARITNYELQKNLRFYKDTFTRAHGFAPAQKNVDEWMEGFTDRAYFLADAYDKGYDTLSEMARQVSATEHYIIAQPGGLLDEWEAVSSGKQLGDAQSAALKKFHVRYVKFKDYGSALGWLDSTANKPFPFDGETGGNIAYGEETLLFPFRFFKGREDLLAQLKENTRTPVLPLGDGFYILNVLSIDTAHAPKEALDLKNAAALYLHQQNMEEVRRARMEKVFTAAGLQFDSPGRSGLEKFIEQRDGLHFFPKEVMTALLPQTLARYTVDRHTVTVTVEDFIDYYNQMPLRHAITTGADLAACLEALVLDDYSYRYAVETGITVTEKFLGDKENFRKNIICALYERNELRANITVSEDELTAWYALNKERYLQPQKLTLTRYSFADRSTALHASLSLRKNRDTAALKGLSFTGSRLILDEDNHPFSDSICHVLFALRPHEATRVMDINGAPGFFVLESAAGTRLRGLEEVRAELVKTIREKKLEEKKKEVLKELKLKYGHGDRNGHPEQGTGPASMP